MRPEVYAVDKKLTIQNGIKSLIFILVGILLFFAAGDVLKEKMHKYNDFYKLEKDSLDYAVVGISHSYYGINPIYIYTHSGLKGYNLADEAQDIRFSYYWLVEMLKTQAPRFLFFDVGSLFYTKTSMAEGWKLKEYGSMPASMDKLRAVSYGTDNEKTKIGVLFPLLYFHNNWKSVTISNYIPPYSPTMGGTIITQKNGKERPVTVNPFNTLRTGLTEEEHGAQISAENQRFFEMMLEKCNENGVRLVAYKPPSNNWDQERAAITKEFLQRYETDLLDLNEDDAIDWVSDTFDGGYRLDYWGGAKASELLGAYMSDAEGENTVSEKPDEKWEKTVRAFADQYDPELYSESSKLDFYIRWLQNRQDQSCIFLVVNRFLSGDSSKIDTILKKLGLSGFSEEKTDKSLVAVISGHEVIYECWSEQKLTYTTSISDGSADRMVELYSSGKSSHLVTDLSGLGYIKVDGKEYSLDQQGLSIAVLDLESHNIISAATILNANEWLTEKEGYGVDYWKDLSVDGRELAQIPTSDSSEFPQNVHVEYVRHGNYHIINEKGEYLSVNRAGIYGNNEAVWSKPNGYSDQLWVIYPEGSQLYGIRSFFNQLLLRGEEGELKLEK